MLRLDNAFYRLLHRLIIGISNLVSNEQPMFIVTSAPAQCIYVLFFIIVMCLKLLDNKLCRIYSGCFKSTLIQILVKKVCIIGLAGVLLTLVIDLREFEKF